MLAAWILGLEGGSFTSNMERSVLYSTEVARVPVSVTIDPNENVPPSLIVLRKDFSFGNAVCTDG